MRVVSNNDMWQARLRQSLSDTFSGRKRTARDAVFQLLGIRRIVSMSFLASDINLRERRKEIAQAQAKLLKGVYGSKRLEMSW